MTGMVKANVEKPLGLNVDKKDDVILTEVVPTLFIGLGGTGAEVLWRIRRNILSKVWHDESDQPFELGNLEEFPFAEFLQIDLDQSMFIYNDYRLDRHKSADPLADRIRFKEEEKLVKKFDLSKYVKTDDALGLYPMVKEWFPLTRSKLNELNIDTSHGAGQIRAISRLYFFDKYAEIKRAIRTKAEHLLANVSSDEAQKRLDLKMQTGALKIVVVASTAGGTGSGMFLDIGYLSGIIGKQAAYGNVTTNLMLTLPTGYGTLGRRKQANTYAALMELETCMRQGSRYIKGWNQNELISDWPESPYSDIYLVDTRNLAAVHTEDIEDVYDMVADTLFDDLSMTELANKKRSVVVCHKQYKVGPYVSRVDRETYGDMKLTFSHGYSSFGQTTLDYGHDSQVGIDAGQENPLFAALDQMPDRTQVFSDFLRHAMPWVDAELDRYSKFEYPECQYVCVIGVKDARQFEAKYGAELTGQLPTTSYLTPHKGSFVEIDTPGKLVCYVELSGLPLPSLKAMDDWYTAYVKESANIPVHTHKHASIFVHPREFTMDELASRVEDFKLFVEAVALGVLTRGEQGENAGMFKLSVNGGTRNVGDERLVRKEGFHTSYRNIVRQQVDLNLEEIRTDDQIALWLALMEYYMESVYPIAIRCWDGVEVEMKALPTFVCNRLVNEWSSRLQSKVGGEMQSERLLPIARDALSKWTEEIPGSTADIYQDEVNFKEIKSKRALKREVLQAGWTLGGVVQQAAPATAPLVAARTATTAIAEARFRAFINKKQEGPWSVAEIAQQISDGVLGADTKVWNMAWDSKIDKWQMASNAPELQGLFVPDPIDDEIPDPE